MDNTSKLDTDEEEDEEVQQHQRDVCTSVRAGKVVQKLCSGKNQPTRPMVQIVRGGGGVE